MLDALPESSDKAAAPDAPPALSALAADLKKVSTETKLLTPLEVAGPIEARPATVAPWIVCLRSAAPDQARQSYALFYRDSKLVSYRFAAIVDRCDQQTYKAF